MGAKEWFTRNAAINSPPVQHSLQKQPHGSLWKQAEMSAPQTTNDITNYNQV